MKTPTSPRKTIKDKQTISKKSLTCRLCVVIMLLKLNADRFIGTALMEKRCFLRLQRGAHSCERTAKKNITSSLRSHGGEVLGFCSHA